MNNKKKKVILTVTNDLVLDQRVHKVSSSLTKFGYDVLLVGVKFKNSAPIERDYKTKRIRMWFKKTALFYMEFNIKLFFYLLFKKTDINYSNDTDSLLPNYFVSKIKRKPLVFDAHELFPELPEVINRPFVKKTWRKIEDFIFPKLKYCYTVSQSIADYYNELYGIDMKLVRNFPLKSSSNNNVQFTKKEDRRILLYQGMINTGRGIEFFIDALPYIDNIVFYIVGDGYLMNDIKQRVKDLNVEDKVKFFGKVPFENLKTFSAQSDLGFCFLTKEGLCHYYALPNKLADYIHSGLPVLAVDFPEIKRIVEEYKVGDIITDFSPKALAKSIEDAFQKWSEMDKEQKDSIFERAKSELCWENEEKVILEVFKSI